MHSKVNPGPGQDLLVGDPSPADVAIVGPRARSLSRMGGGNGFTPTGGAYLFAPGRSGLAKARRTAAHAGIVAGQARLGASHASVCTEGVNPSPEGWGWNPVETDHESIGREIRTHVRGTPEPLVPE
jgi:hypothetical protein